MVFFPPTFSTATHLSIRVFFSFVFSFVLWKHLRGGFNGFLRGGVFFPCNLPISFVRSFITGTWVFRPRFTIHPSSSYVVCFFLRPSIFHLDGGVLLFSYFYFLDQETVSVFWFFWFLTFSYFLRIICCTCIGLSFYFAYINFFMSNTLCGYIWVLFPVFLSSTLAFAD